MDSRTMRYGAKCPRRVVICGTMKTIEVTSGWGECKHVTADKYWLDDVFV